MLIDGGGQRRFDIGDDDRDFEPDSPRIGEAITSAYLWAKGYSRIDYLLATHADADHIQGLTDVANNFTVRFALVGRSPNDDPDFDEFASALGRTHVPLKIISRGDELEIGGVQVQILFPEADETYAAISDNDHSVVIRLVLGKRKILMTGDIERSAEMNILAEQAVDADVVKVPHHGSRTSSTDQFVSAVHPSLAVISVGKRSVFGHPHPEVVERWRNSGSAVLTTGRSGTISVSTDGSDLVWERFVDERK
jgi:competence protein ComEC